MQSLLRKQIFIPITVLAAFTVGALIYMVQPKSTPVVPVEQPVIEQPTYEVIGTSVQKRNIETYTYGKGETHLLLVGGIHGGYEWNGVALAYEVMDYLKANPDSVPKNMTVTIIPSANPDGVYKLIGKEGRFAITDVPKNKDASVGRFNTNKVDLNRNFACNWKPKSTWRSATVSAGTKAFSEPETLAIKNFVEKHDPDAVVFWHSQANTVYASECNDGILPKTLDIMNAYAKAAKYSAVKSFDAYEITGDADGWLASIGIPAITVELKTHETIEFDKNLAGVKALFNYFRADLPALVQA